MMLLLAFAYYGGPIWVAGLLAWVGYAQRARRPGFNRWYAAAAVCAALGAAALCFWHLWAGAMRGVGG
ncbi:hypothetical protein [Lysobacter sp. TAB13]|uniref:hypothetical protein n=1 Tax=Lysobacter sp. TAB13 TaxID=3233065 RepID=UPI003F98CD12